MLKARRFETSNLAAVGAFQRSKAPKPIKKLKYITIAFPTLESKFRSTKGGEKQQLSSRIRAGKVYDFF